MKNIRILTSSMLCAAGLAALGANANAATIPVVDPLFDEFPTVNSIFDGQFTVGTTAATYLFFKICGTGCAFADDNVVGWSSTETFSPAGVSGQWQTGVPQNTLLFNSDPMINATTPEPIVLRAQNAAVSQIVSTTAVAGVTYTLDVDLGFEKNNIDEGVVELMVGDNTVIATPLASLNLTQNQMQETGNWYDFEVSYTATAADAGDPIEILLNSQNHGQGFAFFGDVRLTDSLAAVEPLATPEPATWAMMLIGFGGMAGVVAMRHRSLGRRSAGGQLA
jgi:hypothetical protein